MAYERTIDPHDLPADEPLCIHLRSKAMIVTGEPDPRQADPEQSHTQGCWCNLTQHILGPDKGLVELNHCTAGRECFRKV